MKKIKYFLVFIAVVVYLFLLRQQYISFANSNNGLIDSLELAEKPLEIEPVIIEFDSIISSEIQQAGTIGAALVVTYKDRIALLKCFGVRKIGEPDSIDINTVFRLASVSKPLTGTMAGMFAEKGIINLDDKIVDYLPEFRLQRRESTQNLTIRNILSHTSGLPAHSYDNYAEQKWPLQNIIPRLQQVNILAPPGQRYAYQNVMFSILDTLLAKKLQKPFDTIIHENLFLPFEMYDASTGFAAFNSNPNKAYPHSGSNGKFNLIRMNDRYYTTSAAAGVNASISDLANFLLNFTSQNKTSVNHDVQSIIFEPQVVFPLSQSFRNNWGKVDSGNYGIGWRIIGYQGRTVAYHGGYVLGYKTEIAYCSQEDIGIAYLSNSPNSTDAIVVPTLLNLLFKFNDNKKMLADNENLLNTE